MDRNSILAISKRLGYILIFKNKYRLIAVLTATLFVISCGGETSNTNTTPLSYNTLSQNESKIITDQELLRFDKYYINNYKTLSDGEKLDFLLTDGFYFGYVIRDFARAYFISKNEDYRQISTMLFNTAVYNFTINGILSSPQERESGYWLRDSFAREMYLILEAYRYSGNSSMLTAAENQVDMWLSKVERRNHNGFLVFPYAGEYGTEASYEINPNQNIEIARLFSELYFTKESKFFKNPLFQDIVYNEVNAALSLLNDDGELSLREYLPLVKDSNYGGYSASMLYYLEKQWQKSEWSDALKSIGEWLYTAFPMSHPWNIPEDAPNFIAERKNSFNLIARLVPFKSAGVSNEYAYLWTDFIKKSFPDENLRLETRWMEYRCFNTAYMLGKKYNFDLHPLVFIVQDNKKVKINILSEHLNNIYVTINDLNAFNGSILAGSSNINITIYFNNQKIYNYNESINADDGSILEINAFDKNS